MWQRAAATFLVIGSVVTGVRGNELAQTHARGAPADLAVPYRHYSLKLRRFCPIPSQVAGVLLKVRINGGRPLELVLDSGADLMVIGTKAARSAGISGGSARDLVGLGNRPAKVGRAETVDIGPVSFRNCRVGFVKGRVFEGANGVIPLSMFSQFRLRLDLHKKTLELFPYPHRDDPAIPPMRANGRHNLLLVSAILNGEQKGYVILDTGAYCSGISLKAARTLSGFPMFTDVPLETGTGVASGQPVSSLIHFAVADQDLTPRKVLAMDLSNVSRHYGLEIIGVLGFPALTDHILTIDYRDGWVLIEPPQSHSAPQPVTGDNTKPLLPLAFR
jgi:Aspartyl protease